MIHQNPQFHWSLQQLGKHAGMSRSTLLRQFKTMLGMSPITYIKNWRMMRAYYLLKYSTKSLEQIAELIGFSSARTMNKAFKQHYGLTPNELRQKQ
ncbi:MAG: helix-turn-helix transcriptional regulator [Alcanivoracaceae bacterium]|nr:helix-turn-helix transcriptional regulator [Alcanivoracaceae bacterium]